MAAWRKYDWGKWFGQKKTTLEYGVDYYCTQSTMIGMIRNNASQRGVRIHVKDNWTSITIEVVDAVPHTDQVAVTGEHESRPLETIG